MNNKIEKSWDTLYEKYPDQYVNLKHINCEIGWFDIINCCCYGINRHIENLSYKIEFYWLDQKSKFGGLRLYYFGGDEYISGVIYMAEALSYKTCYFCGNSGNLCIRNNWFETFCESCRIRHQYEIYNGKTF